MMGISYGGISQLFTAQLNPPHLEAISPLSVLDATATTLYPGRRPQHRLRGRVGAGAPARSAARRTEQPASRTRTQQIQGGDTTCAANQVLHGEAADLSAKIAANSHYVAAVADPLDPVTFVHKIKVPVFMACQWEDEQTGGHCPELVRHFTGTKQKWFTFTNGAHVDSLDPTTYNRWYDFLRAVRRAPGADRQNAAITRARRRSSTRPRWACRRPTSSRCRPTPSSCIPTYDAALAAFDAASAGPGAVRQRRGQVAHRSRRPRATRTPGSSTSFSSLPVPGTTARTWYLGPSGALAGASRPRSRASTRSPPNAHALPLTDFGSNTGTGGLWGNASQWQWNWQQNPAGTAVSYVSEPLTANTTVVGSGAVHLWVRSSTPDVDLQATISEVRPDGNETFVQNGWIRASERKLSTDSNNMFKRPSTALEPIPTFTAADAVADARRPVREGRRPALLPGPRVPRGIAASG